MEAGDQLARRLHCCLNNGRNEDGEAIARLPIDWSFTPVARRQISATHR